MIRSCFLTELVTRELIGSKYAVLKEDFKYYSAILGRVITVPAGFVCDYESIPLFKSDSKRAGVLHDFLSRFDSDPIVSKVLAAAVYAEAQALRDQIVYEDVESFKRTKLFFRRAFCWFKTSVVKVWPGYFHKFSISATAAELAAGA